jgi:Flp pilus assembly protein TadG
MSPATFRESRLDAERGASPASVIILLTILLLVAELILMSGRYAAAHADVSGAAQEAARRSSTAQNASSVYPLALATATSNVDRNTRHCQFTTVSTAGTQFRQGGHVKVAVTCRVDLSDLSLLSIPWGGRMVKAEATELIETYRAVD